MVPRTRIIASEHESGDFELSCLRGHIMWESFNWCTCVEVNEEYRGFKGRWQVFMTRVKRSTVAMNQRATPKQCFQ